MNDSTAKGEEQGRQGEMWWTSWNKKGQEEDPIGDLHEAFTSAHNPADCVDIYCVDNAAYRSNHLCALHPVLRTSDGLDDDSKFGDPFAQSELGFTPEVQSLILNQRLCFANGSLQPGFGFVGNTNLPAQIGNSYYTISPRLTRSRHAASMREYRRTWKQSS